jgi:hypothetical protein
VLYLQVYVCSGGSACATSGTPQLKAKIGIQDPTGAPIGGARQIVVYSWSVQR